MHAGQGVSARRAEGGSGPGRSAGSWLGWLWLLVALAGALPVHAATVMPDTLRPATGHVFRLSDYPGPYIFEERAVVLAGDTLLAGPGDSLVFRHDSLRSGDLLIYGTVLAIGDEDNLVTFCGHPENVSVWQGIQFRQQPSDSSTSVFEFTQIDDANTAVNVYRAPAAGQAYTVDMRHSLVTRGIYGCIMFGASRVRNLNCLFDDQSYISVYSSGCPLEIINSVFLPNEEQPLSKAISIYNPPSDPVAMVRHSLFHLGEGDPWSGYFVSNMPGQGYYTYHQPGATCLVEDPHFLADAPYHPDPVSSPLVDAGDPAFVDPDGTVSDIGVFWVQAEDTPVDITGALSPTTWVTGMPYAASFDVLAYPAPQFTLSGAPAGMTVVQLGRQRAVLGWPAASQWSGHHSFWIHAANTVNGIQYRDSLQVELDFQDNRAPAFVLIQPCPGGGCAEIVDNESSSPTGETVSVYVVAADPDEEILGSAQPYLLDVWIDGQGPERREATSFQTVFTMDTLTHAYVLRISDGQLSDSVRLAVRPLFRRLSGLVEGVLDPSDGIAFVTGPLRVAAGDTLAIQPGMRLVTGALGADEWLLDVEGRLELSGSAQEPLEFFSQVEVSSTTDERPSLLRVGPGAQLGRISHLDVSGFATAIQLEQMEGGQPVQVDSCVFENVRLAVLAVDTPVEIRHNLFLAPGDLHNEGSSAVYLAGATGSRVQNNLFINPIVGVTAVDAQAVVAHNDFIANTSVNGSQLGFGRIHSFGSRLDVRNNLFQWRMALNGTAVADSSRLAQSSTCAIWLDEASTVDAGHNWYDCLNLRFRGNGFYRNWSREAAINDSLLLASHVVAGIDTARVDNLNTYRLFEDSPLIDAGDPAAAWNDAFDGSRADVGWTGGPLATEAQYTAVEGRPADGPDPLPLPEGFVLHDAAPNPFNPYTHIDVDLQRADLLDVRVYDMLGRQVAVVVRDRLEAGRYRLRIDGSGWASGVYIARARLGNEQRCLRLVLVK